MNIIQCKYPDTFTHIHACCEARREALIVDISDQPWMITGSLPQTYSQEESGGIPVVQLPYPGGTGIVFPGDLSILQLAQTPTELGRDMMAQLEAWLERRGIHTREIGNDLLLFERGLAVGKKVASHAEGQLENGLYFSGLRVSVNTDDAAVKRICTKRREKQPGSLGPYGVSAEELWAYLSRHLPEAGT